MKTLSEKIAVMQAALEGEKIEFSFNVLTPEWRETPEPIWNWDDFDYRVAPEDSPCREADKMKGKRCILSERGEDTFRSVARQFDCGGIITGESNDKTCWYVQWDSRLSHSVYSKCYIKVLP